METELFLEDGELELAEKAVASLTGSGINGNSRVIKSPTRTGKSLP